MTPLEVGPAITRLLMLTAAASTDHDAEAIEAALAAFDSPTARRELIWQLIPRIADKLPPVGAAVLVSDEGDAIAVNLIQLWQKHGPRRLSDTLDTMPDELVSPVAVFLIAMWHSACHQRADYELARVRIPDTPDPERSR